MSYKLVYTKTGKIGFITDKDEYEPGEPVRVIYFPIATDECYSFTINADDTKIKYKESVAEITFTMPEHDVEMDCSSKSMWSPSPMPGLGMGSAFDSFQHMGMINSDMQKPAETAVTYPSTVSKWVCPNCNGVNAGRFCGECGTPKPVGM
jgi:hypothetical protein